MEKKPLRKLISNYAIERGFEKISNGVFSCAAADGDTILLLRIPDMTQGFLIGAQFRSLGLGMWKDNLLTNYQFESLLAFADRRDYTEDEVASASEAVFRGLEPYLSKGKSQICEDIDAWMIRPQGFQQRNQVRAYLGLQANAAYSDAHLQDVLDTISRGGGLIVRKEAYLSHISFFNKLIASGCRIIHEDTNWVQLSYGKCYLSTNATDE